MNQPLSTRRCHGCQADKPHREFYESCPSLCMACKRAMSNAYKRRTGYNIAYGERRRAAAAR